MSAQNVGPASWSDLTGGGSAFLERSHLLAALHDALGSVAPRGKLVFVGGEAGVGKSTLVRRFCGEHQQSARVIVGSCDALFTPRALGPLLGIADALGGKTADLVRSGARPHEVASALLEALRGKEPVIMVIEDAHWADQATLDVLRLICRQIDTARALLLVTYRDDELSRTHPLRLLLGELPTKGAVVRLTLERLSREAVHELASGAGVDVGALYRLTGGNPFFVTEVLAAGGARIPATVRDAVLARAARLTERARRVLDVVSVIPGTAEITLLESIMPDDIGSVDECLASGMLVPASGGVSFRHELARLAVEESVAPDRKLALHRAVLATLAQAGRNPDAARLAHHAEAAYDTELVLRYAPAAAVGAASLGAHREAAAQYARALRFADRASDEYRVALFEAHAQECYLTGQFPEAIGAQEQALELHRRSGNRRAAGDALRRLSRLRFYVGGVEQSRRDALEAVAILEQAPPGRELAWAYSNVSMQEEEPEEVLLWGGRAVDLAERLGDDEILCHALTNIGAWQLMDRDDEGIRKLERSREIALEAGFEEAAGRAFSLLSIAATRVRRYPLVEEALSRGIDYVTARDLSNYRLILLAHRARVELDQGRWEEAMTSALTALREGTEPYRVFALPVVALVRARRGDPELWPPLDEALSLAPSGELLRAAPLAAARAEAAWLEGRNDAAIAETSAAFELALDKRAWWAVGELGSWRRRAGVREQLPPEVDERYAAGDWHRAEPLWRELGCPYEAALALADADTEGPLRQAHGELTALGAKPAAEIVARRLRERGIRVPRGPRAGTRHNPAGLTERELDVLRLVGVGLRNRDIADRLFLSGKTVDHHVSAILRKLRVRTRGEAAVAAARLGITVDD